jgi:hypothetical protein
MPESLDRRKFLQATALAGLGLCLGSTGALLRMARAGARSLAEAAGLAESPLAEISGPFVSGVFNGDDVSRPHDILWDREGYIRKKGGRPTTFTTISGPAVIGGGMSGLLAAYLLRSQSPVLFEQAPSFGGNSKGEKFRGRAFSLGAAYITVPEEGGEIDALLKELGLSSALRHESGEDSRVYFPGQGLRNLWKGETDGAASKSAREVEEELRRIYESAYPEIPWTKNSALSRAEFEALDKESADRWLVRKFPGLHPHVKEYFQLYCWSSFGASLEELSAAQFLNFVAAETAGVLALPGGNAAIGDALYRSLARALPEGSLRTGAIVIEVKNTSEGAEILFEDQEGKLRLLRAGAAVVAAPKYVARYIVAGLEPARLEYWKGFRYRAYAVANVQLSVPVPQRAFDVFALEGKVPDAPSFGHRTDRPWCDFVYAGWAASEQSGSVLTLYKPYPFEGARSLLTSELAHARIKEEIEAFLPKTLAGLGIAPGSISGIRLTRWAHALPLAETGLASSPDFERHSSPLGRIAFANQDNFANPAFESCFLAAKQAAAFVASL